MHFENESSQRPARGNAAMTHESGERIKGIAEGITKPVNRTVLISMFFLDIPVRETHLRK